MAEFVIQNKVYDTDRMMLIGKVQKWYKFEGYFTQQMFGENVGTFWNCDLFVSKKRNYLLVYQNDRGQTKGQAIDEAEAKELLARCDYASYVKVFGELEEA